jgi:hypothetical protein
MRKRIPPPSDFHGSNCGAMYEIVRLEAPPGPTTGGEITCLSCGTPLHGRDGKFVLSLQVVALRHESDVDGYHLKTSYSDLRGKGPFPEPARWANNRLMQRIKTGFYSITSSARSRNASGIVRPSALAVVRLMTNSNLIGCSTGMSPGFVPRRILSTNSTPLAHSASVRWSSCRTSLRQHRPLHHAS